MFFIHIKFFGNDLNSQRINDIMSKSCISFSKSQFTHDSLCKKDCYTYSIDVDDIQKYNVLIGDVVDYLCTKENLIYELKKSTEGFEFYLVLTPYIDNYQTIITLDNITIDKLSKIGIDVVIDVMNV